MKISKDIVLTEVAGDYVAVPVGKAAEKQKVIFRLNETAHAIWQGVEAGRSVEAIALQLTEEYEVPLDAAREKVSAFLAKLAEAGILED